MSNNKTKKQFTLESWMIANAKSGKHFYSDKLPNHLTAIASHHNKSITTERILAVTTDSKAPKSKYITKVVLL